MIAAMNSTPRSYPAPMNTTPFPAGPIVPDDVRAFFHGIRHADDVRRAVDALRADPSWVALAPMYRAPEWLIQVVYTPSGQPQGFRAVEHGATLWRFL